MKISAHYLEKLRILLILLPIQVTSFLILPIEESISPAFPSKRNVLVPVTWTREAKARLRDGPTFPIVLVPGDGGSRIQANLTGKKWVPWYWCYSTTKDYFDLWVNFGLLTYPAIDCWADNMRLLFNNTTLRSEPMPNVETRIPGFNQTETIEWLDASHRYATAYFSRVVDNLVAWGYRRGKNIVGAPYDFRKSPLELENYFIELRDLIEKTYRWNRNTPVVILAHSLGNLVLNHFYQNHVDLSWKNKYVKAHFGMGAPWGGAMQTMRLFASGYNLDNYRIILSPIKMREMQRSFTSSAYLFPNPQFWQSNETLASDNDKNYTMENLDEFFNDINYELGYIQLKGTRDNSILKPPGVEWHCVYGVDIETAERFTWNGNFDKQPKIAYGNGDGTVNYRSLEHCKKWTSKRNNGNKVVVHELSGTTHMGILYDKEAILLLHKLLFGDKKSVEN